MSIDLNVNDTSGEFMENPVENDARKLATVTRIKSVSPIEGADRIECVSFQGNGWQCVAGKGEFRVGDSCVFLEIDSFLPKEDRYSVLEGRCNKVMNGTEGYRLKSAKFKSCISQGLALPLSKFPEIDSDTEEGADVTELLKIKLWQRPVTGGFGFNIGKPLRSFPTHIMPKTDQTRIQSMGQRDILELFQYVFEVTEKCDGTSCSMYCNKRIEPTIGGGPNVYWDFGVCSRNLELKEPAVEYLTFNRVDDEGNEVPFTKEVFTKSVYWDMAYKYHIRERLVQYCKGTDRLLALQGEIMGPGIQKNPFKLKEAELFVFDIYDIEVRQYVSAAERDRIICCLNSLYDDPPIQQVPGIGFQKISPDIPEICAASTAASMQYNDLDDKSDVWNVFLGGLIDLVVQRLVNQADGQSAYGGAREGIVFKSVQNPMVSFKIISNAFLLKEKE